MEEKNLEEIRCIRRGMAAGAEEIRCIRRSMAAFGQGQKGLLPKRLFTLGDPAEIRRGSAGDPAMTSSFSEMHFSPCSWISAEIRPEILALHYK